MAVSEAASIEPRARPLTEVAARNSGVLIAVFLVLLMEFAARFQGINAFSVLVNGLALGSLYAVVALGYTMVYGIIELINFAHGDVFTFGAYASLWLMDKMDSNLTDINGTGQYDTGQHTVNLLGVSFHAPGMFLAIWTIVVVVIFSAVVCAILGVVVERVAYRPLRNAPRLAPLITAIGASLILENSMLQWRGGAPLNYPSIIPHTNPELFGAIFQNVDIILIVVAVVMMVILDRFVNGTKLGKAMRAVAQDREAAQMMGIDVNRIIAVTFIVGSALAGVGAVIYGMDQSSIGYNGGFTLGLFAFTAAVLGGIGNIRGAMLGGLLIGMVQQYINAVPHGSAWSTPAVFAVLVLVLVFRPSGLLGTQLADKV